MSVTAVPIQPVKRSYILWIWVGVAFAIAAAFLLARQGDVDKVTPSGLKYRVVVEGKGPHPNDTDIALIGYEGRFADGTVFDSNPQAANPVNGFVPGFTEALKLMSKGGKMHVVIPSKLAYGPKGKGSIPPNADLTFDITLLDFISQEQYQQMMLQRQMMMGGGAGGPGGPGGAGPGGGAPGEEPGADTEKPATKGSK